MCVWAPAKGAPQAAVNYVYVYVHMYLSVFFFNRHLLYTHTHTTVLTMCRSLRRV